MAHAYTRYLGDLSGGQVLGKITQKSLGLSSKEGLSFFAFPGVTSPNRFKQLYRSRMNSIELTERQRVAVLQEAVKAFELNIQVNPGGIIINVLNSEASLTHNAMTCFLLEVAQRGSDSIQKCTISAPHPDCFFCFLLPFPAGF